jgi:hypothetical protein
MTDFDLKLFALNAARGFGEKVLERLSVPLGKHEECGTTCRLSASTLRSSKRSCVSSAARL